MRLVLMGTPDFAVPSLMRLLSSEHRVAAVVTQPDRPRGRSGVVTPPPVKTAAASAGVRVLQPSSVRQESFIRELDELQPELVITVAYGQILPCSVLEMPSLGCVNLHASLLPLYRGAAPIHRAVINGDPVTGVSTMFMDEGLDTGDIILQAALPVGPAETTGDVHDRLAALGAEVLLDTVNLLAAGVVIRRAQDSGRANYALRLDRADELICWERPAVEVVNMVRGMNPWPGAHTTVGDRELKILRAEHYPAAGGRPAGEGVPGEVTEIVGDLGLTIRTGDGGLVLVREVQPAGKRPMDALAFVNGYRIKPGIVLGNTGGRERDAQ